VSGLRIAVAGGYFREAGNAGKPSPRSTKVASCPSAPTAKVILPEAARARSAAYVITTAEILGAATSAG